MKIGDKVYVSPDIGAKYPHGERAVGQVGTIIGYDGDFDYDYKVEFAKWTDWFYADELIPEEIYNSPLYKLMRERDEGNS